MKSQKQELLQLSSITDINLYQYLVLNNNWSTAFTRRCLCKLSRLLIVQFKAKLYSWVNSNNNIITTQHLTANIYIYFYSLIIFVPDWISSKPPVMAISASIYYQIKPQIYSYLPTTKDGGSLLWGAAEAWRERKESERRQTRAGTEIMFVHL